MKKNNYLIINNHLKVIELFIDKVGNLYLSYWKKHRETNKN